MNLPPYDDHPTIPVLVRHVAEQYGNRDFIVSSEDRITYETTELRSRLVAKQLLSRGSGKGTRIAFMFGNSPSWVLTWLAIARIGAIAMPLSTLYRPAELIRVLRIADVDTLITSSEVVGRDQSAFLEATLQGLSSARPPFRFDAAPFLRSILIAGDPLPTWGERISLTASDNPDLTITDKFLEAIEAEVHPSDPMVTVFTSGTSADPKAIVHSHGGFVRHTSNYANLTEEPYNVRLYGGSPFFWVGGLSTTIGTALHRGNTIVCSEKPDADAVADLILRERLDHVGMWSTQFERVKERIRAKVPEGDVPAFARASSETPFRPGPRAASSLGMTETCAGYIVSGPRGHIIPKEYEGAHGFKVPEMQYKIVDPETGQTLEEGQEGEICLRGYNLMLRMWKKERHEYLDDDGFYHTGDRGSLRGPYIFFTGRIKEMIKTSGANVAPREVEVVLNSCDGVLTSVVVGVPDPQRQEIVSPAVVPLPGVDLDVQVLVKRCKEDLSSYKVPRRVLIVEDELPMLFPGKPDLNTIKKQIIELGVPV
jgi:acyl-CoA synthetase (AMP-forming)/AMP-acid ligase II